MPLARRPTQTTPCTSGVRRHSRRTPWPIMPVAPNRIGFIGLSQISRRRELPPRHRAGTGIIESDTPGGNADYADREQPQISQIAPRDNVDPSLQDKEND